MDSTAGRRRTARSSLPANAGVAARRLRRAAVLVVLSVAALGGCGRDRGEQAAPARATPPPAGWGDIERLVDSVMAAGMAAEHIPGAAFVLVRDGRVVLRKGYGFADVEARRPVVADSTVWPIGSITKVFTATAVVQLADRGKLDLNADVNRYLRRVQVPPTFPQPVTAAHLLTHTAGFDELPGRLVRSAAEVRPLDRFLRDRLVRIRPPGVLTAYSSYGMALAGALVEDVSGLPYDEYVAREILAPLGMRGARVMSRAGSEAGLATGYEVDGDVARRVPYEWYHTPPASSLVASAADMAAFMIAQLDGGAYGGGRILSERATREMQAQHTTVHPLIPGFGYGFQMSDANGERIVEHGGDIGGFGTLMVLLPDARTGFFVAHHREGSELRYKVRRALLDRYFPAPPPTVPHPDSAAASRVRRFAGRYRPIIFCHSCSDSGRTPPDVVVTANADGTISLFDARWVETSPRYFRSLDGTRRIGFAEDEGGRIIAASAGSWQVLERVR